jgi:hypothetical protein
MRSDHESITFGNTEWAELVEADKKQTARIAQLEAALRETIDALEGSYDVEYLTDDEDSEIRKTLRNARNVLVPNAGLSSETKGEQW